VASINDSSPNRATRVATTAVAFHEDRVGGVDHDLPDVVVGEEGGEGAVAGEVAEGSFGDAVGVDELVGAAAAAVVVLPALDLVVDEPADGGFAFGAVVEVVEAGSVLDGVLDDR
jgi:hypothetical protein